MDGRISIAYLQSYIKSKEYHPELVKDYFLKLAEETGELARAMHKDLRPRAAGEEVRGTIDEELWDIMYFVLAIANCYGIDLEAVIPRKEAINHVRYPGPAPFELDR